jgi:hypothetical protein
MKGLVFTEFIEMVEGKFGDEMVEDIIELSNLESGGAYTSVGTYPHEEMVSLVSNLSLKTDIPIETLLTVFGKYLFGVFETKYSAFFTHIKTGFDFLETIENHIHIEVKKLYPDAELPTFKTTRLDENTLEMIYSSERKMSALAKGLIEATFEYYQENINIDQEVLNSEATEVKFLISKNG